MICMYCGAEIVDGLKQCPFCKNILTNEGIQQVQTPQPISQPISEPMIIQNPYPMKWYTFVTRVQWILVVLFSLSYGISYLSGDIYGVLYHDSSLTPDAIYRVYPGLKPVDILCGLLLWGYGVYTVFVWRRLIKFRKNAPFLYIVGDAALNVIMILMHLIHVLNYAEKGVSVDSSYESAHILGYITFTALFCWLNWIYFRRRASIFVN